MSSSLDHLLDAIYGVVAEPARWPQVLTQVSDHLGAIGGMLAYNALRGDARSLIVVGRLDDDLASLYCERYINIPWNIAMTRVPFDEAHVMNSLVDPAVVRRTEHYAVILEPQQITDMVGSKHRALTDHGGAGGFGFALSARGADDSDHVREKFQNIVPHLNRALDASLMIGRLADTSKHLAQIMQLMPNPALLLDGKGRVKLTNAAGDALLSRGDGLVCDMAEGGTLTAAHPAERRALAAALTSALDVTRRAGVGPGEPVKLSRLSDGLPFVVLPVPLAPPAFEIWELLDPPRVLVLIIDPMAHPGSVSSLLQSSFKLTIAEARVVELISSGLTVPQAAGKLAVSPTTVKTHLKHVFDKIGVNSQVALARLIGGLPAIAQRPANGKDRS